MKHLITVLVPFLLLVAGCTGDGLVGPDLVGDALAKNEVKYVPYKASWIGWEDPSVDLGVDCGALYLYPARHHGSATLSGYTTVVSNHCLNFATGEVTKGAAISTAANGDLQYWRYHGQAYPDGSFRFELELTGGTGRLENVTSRDLRHEGAIDEDGLITYTTTGWISTVGSGE